MNIALINLGGYLKYYLRYFSICKYNSLFKRNSHLLVTPNKTCYVCALGPSLKSVDLMGIKGDTIVVNRFYKMRETFPNFVPDYYLMIDGAWGSDKLRDEFIEALDAYKSLGTKYILNSSFADLSFLKEVDYNNHYYVACSKGFFSSKRTIEVTKAMPAFGNVACTAIGLAMAMGYKRIVLLGCDFNSFAQTYDAHCYGGTTGKRKIALDYELFCYSFDAHIHRKLAEYAKNHGVEIINSTKGSLIDAYSVVIDENLYRHD